MKLNQILAGIGILGLSMTACTADEQLGVNQNDGAISYKVNTSNQTRAAHSYCANNMPGAFKVWATYTSDEETVNYIEGVTATKANGSSYQTNPVYKWPGENIKMDFYGVVDAEDLTVENGKVIKNYTVAEDVKQQKDLMYAVATTTSPTKDAAENPTVTLNFRHALSQVAFQAQNENPNIKITINSISINNVYGSGNYTLPTSPTNDNYVNHDNIIETNEPVQSLSRGSWDTSSNDIKDNFTIKFEGTAGEVTTPASDATSFTVDKLTEHSDGNNNADLILTMLPQYQETGSSFKINLTMSTRTGDGDKYVNPITNDVEIPAVIDWSEGNRYVYTFKFANDWTINEMKDISYTCTADDYITNSGHNDYEIPPHHNAVLMREADNANGISALYFAETNIGADSETEPGLFFWWGDTHGHSVNYETNKVSDGFWFEELDKSENKHNEWILTLEPGPTASTLEYVKRGGYVIEGESFILNDVNCKYQLSNRYDAAKVKWGGNWRMPTANDLDWLLKEENCEWQFNDGTEGQVLFETDNSTLPKHVGSKGYFVLSKSTGNIIYLPVTGYCQNDNYHAVGVFYWSSTYGDYNEAGSLYYDVSDKKESRIVPDGVYNGYQIRPVCYSLE